LLYLTLVSVDNVLAAATLRGIHQKMTAANDCKGEVPESLAEDEVYAVDFKSTLMPKIGDTPARVDLAATSLSPLREGWKVQVEASDAIILGARNRKELDFGVSVLAQAAGDTHSRLGVQLDGPSWNSKEVADARASFPALTMVQTDVLEGQVNGGDLMRLGLRLCLAQPNSVGSPPAQ
jgi:hypothetical protein